MMMHDIGASAIIHYKNVRIQRFREELQRISDSQYRYGGNEKKMSIDEFIEMYDKHFGTSLRDGKLVNSIIY